MNSVKNLIIYIIGIIVSLMIILGFVHQIVKTKCKTIDKNTSFWVRNCDYK